MEHLGRVEPMRAAWYERPGPAREVLRFGPWPGEAPRPAAGEVLVRLAWSGVNPSDVKRRAGWRGQGMAFPRQVPHNDGAGVIVAVGAGVDPARIGARVWLAEAARGRAVGTAAEFCAVPERLAVALPEPVPLEVGACLGVPAMTAHRAVFADGPVAGRTVLVTGGAGAVGFYAVQLARWGGARVVATARGARAEAVRAAGAEAVLDHGVAGWAEALRGIAPGGLDRVVEVDLGANLAALLPHLAPHATIAAYASMAEPEPRLPFYAFMTRNLALRTVFVYDMPEAAKLQARADITAWLAAGSARHRIAARFPLAEIAAAHEAVEQGADGKVLVRIAP